MIKTVDKKKIKSTNNYALVTQIKFHSKNLQLIHNILWFYCIELFKRMPKHPSLHFSEFPTIFYGISKFSAKITKGPLLLLFI